MKQRYIYMAVTNDKYELPIFVSDTQAEMAEWAGVAHCSISSYLRNKARRHYKKYKIVKVDREDE